MILNVRVHRHHLESQFKNQVPGPTLDPDAIPVPDAGGLWSALTDMS